jgi:hypothetical protein
MIEDDLYTITLVVIEDLYTITLVVCSNPRASFVIAACNFWKLFLILKDTDEGMLQLVFLTLWICSEVHN